MAYVFLGLIVLFAAASIYYLFANDFARETLEILFPAIGAILFSGYLGFKSIVLDAPQPIRFGTSIAVLHDSVNGVIRGKPPSSTKYLPQVSKFRGAALIDTLPSYNAFKTIAFNKTLRDISGVTNNPAEVLMEHIIEYAILEWLCNSDLSIGYKPGHTTKLIHSTGSSGSLPIDLVSTPFNDAARNENPLIKANPIKIPLPKGSSVDRSGDKRLSFTIRTPHTTVEFRHTGGTTELLGPPIGSDAARIYIALGIPKNPQGFYMRGFAIETTATQKPFWRYSKQAKIEREWIIRLQAQLEKDFSWERLKATYIAK